MASSSSKLSTYRRKRDFARTAEPRGGSAREAVGSSLEFVVQKHAASHLHYDLRLELDGVMKSWAVPKGPSRDPAVKRLAMEVEDHPMEYNSFEGTIPQGEYGGGTVMLWDRGTYTADEKRPGESDAKAVRRGYRAGKLSFTFHGDRLRGSYALVRTRRGESEKPQWLLIKHRDEEADETADITAEVTTSVASGRTMEEIAAGQGGTRTWRSNRSSRSGRRPESPAPPPPDLSALQPMLAKAGTPIRDGTDYTFEPKYDGIRVLAYATARGAALVTRNGNDKSKQFPEISAELARLSEQLALPVVLDGEVVGLRKGAIMRFESLQGRMHLTDAGRIRTLASEQPAALVAFDLLLVGEEALLPLPWRERRARLEALFEGWESETIQLGDTSPARTEVESRAAREGWEGVVAKRTDSPYRPGQRTGEWVKLKMEGTQEFVVGGWTEPRRARQHFGAILLGYYRGKEFVYAGHTGTGFTAETLREMQRRLSRLERKTSPFQGKISTNEPAHWVTPRVVVQIRFNEWTSAGVLRQPVFVGFRDDKDAKEVVREDAPTRSGREEGAGGAADTGPDAMREVSIDSAIARQIRALQKARKGGMVTIGGDRLSVSNPGKIFFPKKKLTKGDLLAYYADMAELILPWMEDRPLVLKRYPNGIEKDAFYQQTAPDDPPEGVRVEDVAQETDEEPKPRLVGGNLTTLLYTIQLGAISYDPWHSRIQHLAHADYTILDLDPGVGATFQTAIQVARWVREEMDALGLHGALKTSGSRGLHIYLPLPPETPLDAATLIAQIVATRVASKHPKKATVERAVKKRPRGTVYVDYLQNILGKTIAGVYAVRAKPGATVSTPIGWAELTDDLDLREFTLRTVPDRVRERGDLWTPAMSQPNSLQKLLSR